jgi:dephospho-CoA kinase
METSGKCLRIGLTGGIASGKSAVETFLRELGWPVLDTDRVAHEVMAPGSSVHRAIAAAFGPGILGPDGAILRRELGRLVFADAEARHRLNALVHPEVGRRWREWLARQTGPLAVVSIPLLHEVGAEKDFDGVLCVWSPEDRMRERLLARGLTAAEADQRIAAQWPVDRKAALADWILKNNGTLDDLRERVVEWVRSLDLEENPTCRMRTPPL